MFLVSAGQVFTVNFSVGGPTGQALPISASFKGGMRDGM